MERKIKVTGTGKLSIQPDSVRLIITQTEKDKSYEKLVDTSAKSKQKLTEALCAIGFDENELKSLYFNINSESESYQDSNGNWKNRRTGYRYTHRMKLEFPRDNRRFSEVMNVLGNDASKPEFTIQYSLANPEAAKNELLAKAVSDSKEKAKLLCKAAGLSLKDIITIDYSWSDFDMATAPVGEFMQRDNLASPMAFKSMANMQMEPENIDITDSVTVVWEIE